MKIGNFLVILLKRGPTQSLLKALESLNFFAITNLFDKSTLHSTISSHFLPIKCSSSKEIFKEKLSHKATPQPISHIKQFLPFCIINHLNKSCNIQLSNEKSQKKANPPKKNLFKVFLFIKNHKELIITI